MNEKLTQLPSLMRVNIVGLATIVRREFRRIVRIWLQTIVPPAITMTLYFVIFGSLIGRRTRWCLENCDGSARRPATVNSQLMRVLSQSMRSGSTFPTSTWKT